MLQAEVSSAGKDQWVVVVVVGSRVAAAVQDDGVVQNCSVLFLSRLQAAKEVAELFRHELVPLTQLHCAFRFIPAVCKAVEVTLEPFQLWKLTGQ